MTRQKKVLIGIGAASLVAVLMIAVFALGVYVGRYGLTRDGLVLTGPGNARQPAAQPDQPQAQPVQPTPGAGGQLREPTLIGRIRRVGAQTLDLATRDGPRQVLLTDETRLLDAEGRPVGRDLLADGQLVAVWGTFANGGQQLTAWRVLILPPDQAPAQP